VGLPLGAGRGRAAARATPLARLAIGAAVLLLLGCTLLLVVGSVPNTTGLVLSTVAALIPAVIYASIVIRLDRYEQEPPRALAAAFAWGAIGAVVFQRARRPRLRVRPVRGARLERSRRRASVVLGAPLVEETFKGLGLVALTLGYRRELDNTLDGLIYGALIGLGFAFTENILYFGGAYLEDGLAGLGLLFVGRAVIGGWGHAVYTGFTGAAIGWARGRYRCGVLRFVVPFLGWLLAVVLHALWNGGAVYLSAGADSDAGFLETLLPLGLVVVLPAVLLLYVVARLSRRRELAILRDQLRPEVELGALTPAEYATVTEFGLRRRALEAAASAGGREGRRCQQRFFETAADLAFRKHHLARANPSPPANLRRNRRSGRRWPSCGRAAGGAVPRGDVDALAVRRVWFDGCAAEPGAEHDGSGYRESTGMHHERSLDHPDSEWAASIFPASAGDPSGRPAAAGPGRTRPPTIHIAAPALITGTTPKASTAGPATTTPTRIARLTAAPIAPKTRPR
jgi:RsiW-degrading membrane proteinase PrsW (M82 family)